MKKKIKTIFIDLDGTALDKKVNGLWTLSNKNKKAIVSTRKKGIEIIVSTGRIGKNANRFVNEIGGNYFIYGNGSLIKNINNEIIFEKQMTINQTIKIIDFAQKNNLVLKASMDNIVYGVSGFLRKYIAKSLGATYVSGYTIDMTIKRHKILLLGYISKSKIKKFTDKINKKYNDIIAVTSAKGYMIEITSKDATKGEAAKFIMNKLKLQKTQTVHIGNTMNDSTVKNHVGTLIAMKNSDKELKKIADYIGPSYKRGGLSKIFNNKYQQIEI